MKDQSNIDLTENKHALLPPEETTPEIFKIDASENFNKDPPESIQPELTPKNQVNAFEKLYTVNG